MADTVDKKTRSRIMGSIRGSDTKMEVAVKPVLEALGFEHQPKGVSGRPDFANMKAMVAVFLDGCFWHGCPEHYREPASNVEFWSGKVRANMARDANVTELLSGSGWRVIRVWEHDVSRLLRTGAMVDAVLRD